MKDFLGIRAGKQAAENILEEDFALGIPRIEIMGDKRVLIENHKGILEYSDEVMRINCGKMIIKIAGEELQLKALSLSELAVTGKILSLEYLT